MLHFARECSPAGGDESWYLLFAVGSSNEVATFSPAGLFLCPWGNDLALPPATGWGWGQNLKGRSKNKSLLQGLGAWTNHEDVSSYLEETNREPDQRQTLARLAWCSHLALSWIEVLKLPIPAPLRRAFIPKPAMRGSLQVGSPGVRCDDEQDYEEESWLHSDSQGKQLNCLMWGSDQLFLVRSFKSEPLEMFVFFPSVVAMPCFLDF